MTPPTAEEVEALADGLHEADEAGIWWVDTDHAVHALRQFAAMLRAHDAERANHIEDKLEMVAKPADVEPVAWRITNGELGYNYTDTPPREFDQEWAARDNRHYEPLYTHSTSAKPAAVTVTDKLVKLLQGMVDRHERTGVVLTVEMNRLGHLLATAQVGVADGWQPIETAPKDGSRVMLWHPEWSAPSTAQFYGEPAGGWKLDDRMPGFRYQPTHWMPLPAAPKPEVE